MNKKSPDSNARSELVEAILDHEEKHGAGIYGMRYCQLCGRAQAYSGMYGAMAADSCNPFRCRSCRVESGQLMLDRWFKGSMQSCIEARRYAYCQFCGRKIQNTRSRVTKVRGLCYLCDTCDLYFNNQVSKGVLPYKVWWRHCKRLYLHSQDTYVLRNQHERNLRVLDARRRKELKLASQQS